MRFYDEDAHDGDVGFYREETLAILGAGPKALAVAAKKTVLERLGFRTPRILLFEKESVAHNWTAKSGLTNGKQPLGTSADKDVGFPYYSFCWGDATNRKVNYLMQEFSWQNFLIANHEFSDWIDRGRPSPVHSQWASYLNWVYQRVSKHIELVTGEITSAEIADGRWKIQAKTSQGETSEHLADGLFITGPGDTKLSNTVPRHPRVLRTEDFWRDVPSFTSKSGCTFGLVGSGETAATVAVALCRANPELHVDLISPYAMAYSRGESYVENHLFTDPFQGNWLQLTEQDRRNFISRTDRGVFSIATKNELDHLRNIEIVPGLFRGVRIDALDQLVAEVEYNSDTETRIYDYLILSIGFDPVSPLMRILGPRAKETLSMAAGALSPVSLEKSVDDFISVRGMKPYLHLPMLSGINVGPGFANLSCLGRLSDHVLTRYVSIKSAPLDRQPLIGGVEDIEGHHGF